MCACGVSPNYLYLLLSGRNISDSLIFPLYSLCETHYVPICEMRTIPISPSKGTFSAVPRSLLPDLGASSNKLSLLRQSLCLLRPIRATVRLLAEFRGTNDRPRLIYGQSHLHFTHSLAALSENSKISSLANSPRV